MLSASDNVLRGEHLAAYASDLSSTIVNWLHRWEACHDAGNRLSEGTEPETICRYWSLISSSGPFNAEFRKATREIVEDSEYWKTVERICCNYLFDLTAWRLVYRTWTRRLALLNLPHFDRHGMPLVCSDQKQFEVYLRRTLGTGDYPNLTSLYNIANLLIAVKKVRASELIYEDESLAYCPCTARLLSPVLGVAKYSVHDLDVMGRIELAHLMASCLKTDPKCCVHSAYKPTQQTKFIYDDFLPCACIPKVPRRNRSKSTSGDFYKPCGSIYDSVEKTLLFMEREEAPDAN